MAFLFFLLPYYTPFYTFKSPFFLQIVLSHLSFSSLLLPSQYSPSIFFLSFFSLFPSFYVLSTPSFPLSHFCSYLPFSLLSFPSISVFSLIFLLFFSFSFFPPLLFRFYFLVYLHFFVHSSIPFNTFIFLSVFLSL